MKSSLKSLLFMILFVVIAFSADAADIAKGTHIKDAKIVLRCKSGKEFTSNVDSKGSFSFTGIDDDCDGATLSLSSSGKYATRKRVEVLKSNKTGDPNANIREAGSGLPTGKRMRSSFSEQTSTFTGDLDGDGTEDLITVTISSSDGSNFKGTVTNSSSVKAGYNLKENKK